MKKAAYILTVGVVCIMLTACGGKDNTKVSGTDAAIGQTIYTDEGSAGKDDTTNDREEEIPLAKMQEMVDKIGLEHAVAYEEGTEDVLSDQIILLCESPSGRYKAYGFISPEYGMNGILIDNVIDQVSNHNFFSKKWVYSETPPTLSESEDFYQVTFTVCQDQEEGMQEILFDTYDTGTMDASGWDKV